MDVSIAHYYCTINPLFGTQGGINDFRLTYPAQGSMHSRTR